MASIDNIMTICSDLDERLSTVSDSKKRKTIIKQHIDNLSNNSRLEIPEFSKDLEWINVSEPLFLSNQLRGKVLVLDFFTYCCINCMHVLPDLHALEDKFSIQDGVAILGVHSAKFLNEKLTTNILSAVLRYDITHPVVNDSEASLWQKLQIVCWPTFVIVGPQGQFLYSLIGEGHRDQLFEFVETTLEFFKSVGQIKSHSFPICLEKSKVIDSQLRFPGKIELFSKKLIISDTGNHRILITDINGIVEEVIGNGTKGFQDGDFHTAKFSSPQGVCVKDRMIYVADTENHAIRQVDLDARVVSTIVGTGQMGNDKDGGKLGINQVISSPWDVILASMPGSTEENIIIIAMAGTHQIWVYFMKDATCWYKDLKYPATTCVRFAGSGEEENRNNSYPQKAGFAQPSGLAVSKSSEINCIYIADSESSSIRSISLKDGAVKALVGGERDPANLFAFGDVDGKGVEAKLQHPLGVALLEETNQLFIADSYNHKIKVVDLNTKICSTLLGTGNASSMGDSFSKGNNSVYALNEPGGLSVDPSKQILYIADTNNHQILVLDLKTFKVSKLHIIHDDSTDSISQLTSEAIPQVDVVLVQPIVPCKPDTLIEICLSINLNGNDTLNQEAPQSWKLVNKEILDMVTFGGQVKGNLVASKDQNITKVKVGNTDCVIKEKLKFLFQLFICSDNDTCSMKKVLVEQTLHISPTNSQLQNIVLNIQL